MTDNLREELLRAKARESRYRKATEAKIATLGERISAHQAELESAREKGGARSNLKKRSRS